MISNFLLSLVLPFLAASSVEPVVWLDDQRVQVSDVIKNTKSARAHYESQIKLMKLAKKACRKRDARAVSEGTLNLDKVPDDGKKPELLLSEIYVCIPK